MGNLVAMCNLQRFGYIENDAQFLTLGKGFAFEFGFQRGSFQIFTVLVEISVVIIELETALDDIRAGLDLLQGKLRVLCAQCQALQLRLALAGNAQRILANLVFLGGKNLGLAQVLGVFLCGLQCIQDGKVQNLFLLRKALVGRLS